MQSAARRRISHVSTVITDGPNDKERQDVPPVSEKGAALPMGGARERGSPGSDLT